MIIIQYNSGNNVIGFSEFGAILTGNNDFEIDADRSIFNDRPHTDYKVNSTLDGIELRDQADINQETEDAAWIEIRAKRLQMLIRTDFRDLPSYAGAKQTEWRTYRQKLRDIPQDYTNTDDVVWPTKPTT